MSASCKQVLAATSIPGFKKISVFACSANGDPEKLTSAHMKSTPLALPTTFKNL